MRDAQLTEIFQDLGIPVTTGEVYVDILRAGHCLVTDLQPRYGTTEKDLLRKLRWLHRNGIVLLKVDPLQRQEVIALDPRVVARSFYARFLWRYVPLEEMLSNLSDEKRSALQRYYNLCQAMEEVLCQIYQPSLMAEGISMYNPGETSNALAMVLQGATREILGVTVPPWDPDIALVWETIKDRIFNGVKYRRICDEVTLVSFGHLINRRDVLEVGVCLRVLSRREITDKFFIVDKQGVFVVWPGTTPERFGLEATHITTRTWVNRYVRIFNRMWRKGVSGKDVIDHMEKVRTSFISRGREIAGKVGEQLTGTLFDYGKFCRLEHTKLSADVVWPTLSVLAQHSVLTPLLDAQLGFVPNIFDEVRTVLRSSS